jgi:hypothetical protein
MNDRLLSKQHVIKMFNINRRTFELWVERDNLPCIKIGSNKRYVRESQLYSWLKTKTINQPISEDITVEKDNFKWKKVFS